MHFSSALLILVALVLMSGFACDGFPFPIKGFTVSNEMVREQKSSKGLSDGDSKLRQNIALLDLIKGDNFGLAGLLKLDDNQLIKQLLKDVDNLKIKLFGEPVTLLQENLEGPTSKKP